MARGHTARADRDVGDGGLAGLHAVEEVLEVALGSGEFDLRVGKKLALGEDDFPFHRRGFVDFLVPEFVDRFTVHDEFEFTAVDMALAEGAVKRDALAFDVGENGAVGVDELGAAFGGLPIFRGADFDGAGAIHAETPLGDVDVVGAPVGDHAAAELPCLPPVGEIGVEAARAEKRAVGDEWARAAPAIPVEAGLHFGGGLGVGRGGIAEGDVDGVDAAEDAVADEFAGDPEFFGGALLRAGLENAFGLAGLLHELDSFVNVMGERLLAVDVFASAHGGDGDIGVPVIGCGDDDGVDIFASDHLAKIIVGVAAAVGFAGLFRVRIVDAFLGVQATGRVDIAHREDFDVIAIDKATEVAAHLFAHADATDGEALARCGGLRPDAARENERCGEEDGGALEELATGGDHRVRMTKQCESERNGSIEITKQ